MSFIVLIIFKSNFGLAVHQILPKKPLISSAVCPTVLPLSFFERIVESSFKKVSVFVEYFTFPLNRIGDPQSFYFGAIAEIDNSYSMFLPVVEDASIYGA